MRAVSYGLPAINILPDEYRKRYLSRLGGILLLALLSGLVLAVVLFQSLQEAWDQTATLQERERRLVAAANSLKAQREQAVALRQKVDKLQATLEKEQKLRGALEVQKLDWGMLLASVLINPPSGIELTVVAKEVKRPMAIEGVSRNGFPPFEQYYNQLSRAPGVSRVSINKTEMKEEGRSSLLTFSLSLTMVGE